MMRKIFLIKFRKGKDYICCENEKDIELNHNDRVLIKTEQGLEDGWVICIFPQKSQVGGKILRKATKNDLKKLEKIKEQETGFADIFKKKVLKHRLAMKLIDVHLSFDEKRLTFFFTAEGRVDFRDLVKDLAGTFRKLIRLQQIGPRDEARLRGGIGLCGRILCCQTFLSRLESITMEKAHEQQLLTVSSSKITGVCGKLMCCLKFEEKMYEELRRQMPKIGTRVKTQDGLRGRVIEHNVLMNKILIELDDGIKKEVILKK